MAEAYKGTGHVVQVIGPVVDVQFEHDRDSSARGTGTIDESIHARRRDTSWPLRL